MAGQMTLFDIADDTEKENYEIKLPEVGEFPKETILTFEKEVLRAMHLLIQLTVICPLVVLAGWLCSRWAAKVYRWSSPPRHRARPGDR
jgi:hypothetical protein